MTDPVIIPSDPAEQIRELSRMLRSEPQQVRVPVCFVQAPKPTRCARCRNVERNVHRGLKLATLVLAGSVALLFAGQPGKAALCISTVILSCPTLYLLARCDRSEVR